MTATRSTKKLYLSDPEKFQHEATVTAINIENDTVTVLLDETIFHPQGGGQPSDKGTINGLAIETASKLGDAFDFDVGHHFSTSQVLNFVVGDKVTLVVDPEHRKLLSRLHTAGHLISNHVQTMFGFKYEKCHLYPDKGIFLVFDPNKETPAPAVAESSQPTKGKKAPPASAAALLSDKNIDELLTACREDIKNDLPITEVELEGVHAGKRGIQIGDYSPFPCAGTHVRLSAVSNIFIDKVKKDKNGLKVTYHLDEEEIKQPQASV